MKKALLLTNHDISILKLGGRVILPLADGEEVLLMFDKEKEPRTYMTKKRREAANNDEPQLPIGPKKEYRSEGHRAAYESKTHRGFQVVKCPTCQLPVKRFGLQIHHRRAHGRLLTGKEKEKAKITLAASAKVNNTQTLSKHQQSRMRHAIVHTLGGDFSCRKCKRKGFKTKAAATMHYMSTHVKGWRANAAEAQREMHRQRKGA